MDSQAVEAKASVRRVERPLSALLVNLRDAAQPQKRDAFIGFAEEDIREVNLLRAKAKPDNSALDFNDQDNTNQYC